MRRRRGVDHRALVHRLRPALQRGHQRDVGGRARLSAQGHLVGGRRALRRDDPLHAVIGQSDDDSGQAICAFVTLEGDDGEGSDELVAEIREHVSDRIGKFARPKRIIWADDLPKTRSGKSKRRLLRDIADGRALGDVTTLRDPDVMSQLEGKIKEEQKADGK